MRTIDNPYRSPSIVEIDSVSTAGNSFRRHINWRTISHGLAFVPALIMVTLFYSLAIHMFASLGAWPTYIGERGFSPLLKAHAHVTQQFCLGWILALLATPAAISFCMWMRPWRFLVRFLLIFLASSVVSVLAMSLAPAAFLTWWWD